MGFTTDAVAAATTGHIKRPAGAAVGVRFGRVLHGAGVSDEAAAVADEAAGVITDKAIEDNLP
jgi:hypothetical protein